MDDLGKLANRYCDIIHAARMSERGGIILRKSRPSDVFKYDDWVNNNLESNQFSASNVSTGVRSSILQLVDQDEEQHTGLVDISAT